MVLVYGEESVSFKSALFAVIISLLKKGNIAVTVKRSEGEKVKMEWRIYVMIVVPKKCDLRINGPGKLVGVTILFD